MIVRLYHLERSSSVYASVSQFLGVFRFLSSNVRWNFPKVLRSWRLSGLGSQGFWESRGSQGPGGPKFLGLGFFFSIIMNVNNLLTNTINILGDVLWQKFSDTLNKILENKLRKSSSLVKLHILKMNSFTPDFQSFCWKFKQLCSRF